MSLSKGEEGVVYLNKTSFYAESGGQVGDRGRISVANATFEVTDCQQVLQSPNHVAHIGRVTSGELSVGDVSRLTLDTKHRQLVQK
jgi:alanyl-tRNA synthetase